MKGVRTSNIILERSKYINTAVNEAFDNYENSKRVSVNVGAAMMYRGEATFEELFSRCETALKDAKISGKGSYVLLAEDMGRFDSTINPILTSKEMEIVKNILDPMSSWAYAVDEDLNLLYRNEMMSSKISNSVRGYCYKQNMEYTEQCQDCPISKFEGSQDSLDSTLYSPFVEDDVSVRTTRIKLRDGKNIYVVAESDESIENLKKEVSSARERVVDGIFYVQNIIWDVNVSKNKCVRMRENGISSIVDTRTKNYAELFRIFTKADNYPIDFHCIAGADRTGTLAFLLESTLGYSPEDIRRDYTYTTLFLPRHFSAIDSLLAGMEAYGSAEEPLRYKAERFLLHCGITPDEILAFQEIMLGPNLSKSEVLEKARFVSALKAEFSKETDVTVIDTSPVVGMMLQCNRLHTITMGNWLFSPVEFSGGDDAGRFLVQLKNTGTREMYAGFQGGARDGSYKLMDVDSKKFYGVFTAEELGKMSFVLKGQSKALLMLEPASDNSVPEGYAEEPLAKPTATMLLARSLGTPPTIDGEIDDVWNTVPSMPMSDIRGMALEGNGDYVRLATNATHDMLYFLVNVVDITPIGEKSEHDSKEAWEGDAIEIFVSCAGCSDYYHFICGRGGSTYDERLKDISWNWENSQCAVASSDNAWTAEIALPLSPLNLEGPVEINVCIADTPGPRLKNLRATGGNFHLREAIVPVWLESPTDAERK